MATPIRDGMVLGDLERFREMGCGPIMSIEKSASTPTIPEDALASEGWLVVKADTP